MKEEEKRQVTLSVSRKVKAGASYEMAEVFLSLSLPVGSTQEDVDEGLATGALMYKSLAAAVNAKVKDIQGGDDYQHPIKA